MLERSQVLVTKGADWLDVQDRTVELQPFLRNSLDRGEAAAIQTALNLSSPLVAKRTGVLL